MCLLSEIICLSSLSNVAHAVSLQVADVQMYPMPLKLYAPTRPREAHKDPHVEMIPQTFTQQFDKSITLD